MRVLPLVVVVVLSVIHYSSCLQSTSMSARAQLGRSILRRVREATEKASQQDASGSSESEDNQIKQIDAAEDIFVGSGSHVYERAESSGTRRDDTPQSGDGEQTASGSDDEDVENSLEDNDASAEASASKESNDEKSQDESEESSTVENASNRTLETSGESSGSEPIEEAATPSGDSQQPLTPVSDSQQQTTAADSASGSSVETQQDSSTEDDSSGEKEEQAVANAEASGSGEAQQTSAADNQVSSSDESTIEVAEAKTPTETTETNIVAASSDIKATKKSEISELSGSTVVESSGSTVVESSGTTVVESSGSVADSEGSSETVADEDEESSLETAINEGEDSAGSAEALRKGMENLSRLLKPVASALDFEVYSGHAKPKEEDEISDEEEKPAVKAEATGESDKAEEIMAHKPVVTKIKKCKKVCALPMTYEQCALPRCGYKMGSIKDLCIWLCNHQKPVCKQHCTLE